MSVARRLLYALVLAVVVPLNVVQAESTPDHLKCYKIKDTQAKQTYTAARGIFYPEWRRQFQPVGCPYPTLGGGPSGAPSKPGMSALSQPRRVRLKIAKPGWKSDGSSSVPA